MLINLGVQLLVAIGLIAVAVYMWPHPDTPSPERAINYFACSASFVVGLAIIVLIFYRPKHLR